MSSTLNLSGLLGLLLAGFFIAGWAHGAEPSESPIPDGRRSSFPANCSFGGVPSDSRQLIVAAAKDPAASTVRVYLFEKRGARWSLPLPPVPGTVGRNGFAAPGEKREGDGKTPSGLYPIQLAFGYARTVATKMPYRQATTRDVWVDDVNSEDYNRWVRREETRASSFEELRRKDALYRYGLVVGYNTDPVVRGLGSAIFVHLWKKEGEPTSGCLALAEAHLVRIMEWLDPGKKPLILLGTEELASAILK